MRLAYRLGYGMFSDGGSGLFPNCYYGVNAPKIINPLRLVTCGDVFCDNKMIPPIRSPNPKDHIIRVKQKT